MGNKRHPGVYLRGNIYWIKYSRYDRPFRESSHSEKESDAVRLLDLRRGDIAHGLPITTKIGRVLIDELIEDMKNDLLANGRSIRNLVWRAAAGGTRAASITTADVKRFIVHSQQGKTSGQIRQELSALHSRHGAVVDVIRKEERQSERRSGKNHDCRQSLRMSRQVRTTSARRRSR